MNIEIDSNSRRPENVSATCIRNNYFMSINSGTNKEKVSGVPYSITHLLYMHRIAYLPIFSFSIIRILKLFLLVA